MNAADALITAGWTVEYTADEVVAYLRCRWCKARSRRAMKACSLCRGSGIEQQRRLA